MLITLDEHIGWSRIGNPCSRKAVSMPPCSLGILFQVNAIENPGGGANSSNAGVRKHRFSFGLSERVSQEFLVGQPHIAEAGLIGPQHAVLVR